VCGHARQDSGNVSSPFLIIVDVSVCVCSCVCTNTCVCVCVFAQTQTHKHTHTHKHARACQRKAEDSGIFLSKYAGVSVCLYLCVCVRVCV